MKTHLRPVLGAAAATAIALATAAPANAATLYDSGTGTVVEGTVEVGAGIFSVNNAGFGSGFSLFTEDVIEDTDPTWAEGYIKPGFVVTHATEGAGTLFGGLSAVASATRGDGDAAGLTPDNPEDVDLEDAYVGWRSGTVFSGLGEDAVTLSAGRQGFQVSDGFLISSGYIDQGKDGAFWLAPRRAFAFAGLAQFDVGGFHGDLFHLRTENTIDVIDYSLDTRATGGNLEYTAEGLGTIGGLYMHLGESDVDTRDGMDVYNLRARGTPFAAAPGLSLAAEWAHQRNSAEDIRENAWYGEVGYTMTDTAWTPGLTYRYSHFDSAYDPLFYGFNGWGTWFQGEIVGEYIPGNTNQNVHMLHASAQPLENLGIGVIGYRFNLDDPGAWNASSKHFADEINVYADWGVTENLFVSAVYGAAFPGDAAEEIFGTNDTTHLFQLFAIVAF